MRLMNKFTITILCLLAPFFSGRAQDQLDVAWTTFLGGSGNDEARAVVVDKFDNVYVCGVVEGTGYPPPQNVPTSFDQGPGGFLASFSPDGTLRWLQYFGCVRPHELVISESGLLYMAGQTAVECGSDGFVDGVVAFFNTAGQRVGRDYTFDGSKDDIVTTIDVRRNPANGVDAVYVAGITTSTDFPVTGNAPVSSFQGSGSGSDKSDGFVAVLNVVERTSSPLELVPYVVTYFGGSDIDEILTLRLGRSNGFVNSVYIGGRTRSGLLSAPGIIQPARLGTSLDDDGFVASLDPVFLRGNWMTFLGAAGNQAVHGLQTDAVPTINPTTGNLIRVCGVNNGSDFPFPGQSGVPPVQYQGGSALGGDVFYLELVDRFVVGVDVSNVSGVASSEDDLPGAFARTSEPLERMVVFSNGILTASGQTENFDAFIYSNDGTRSFVSEYKGNGDDYVLDSVYARFSFGGYDAGPKSRYFCGVTTSTNLPGIDAAGPIFQRTPGGGQDAYIVKLGCAARTARITATDSVLCACAAGADSVILTIAPSPKDVKWDDGSTSAARVVRGPGTYKLEFTEVGGCRYIDSVIIRAGTTPVGKLTQSGTIDLCTTPDALITVNGSNFSTIQWSGGTVVDNQTIRVSSAGKYWAILTSSDGCVTTTDTVTVTSLSGSAGISAALGLVNTDSVEVGETARVTLRITAPAGTSLETLPVDWSAVVQFDRWILHPVRPLTLGTANDSIRTVSVSGRRKPSSDTLGVFAFRVALGPSDSATIIVDSLVFEPCAVKVPGTALGIKIAGICQAGGVKRFITTARNRLRVAIAPNPVGGMGSTVSADGVETGTATARIVDLVGQTIDIEKIDGSDGTVQWLIPNWLPTGRYACVVTSGDASSSVIFEVVR
ncbi:MAG: hypothetical protein RIR53_2037 [Bacteroidota bacterium]